MEGGHVIAWSMRWRVRRLGIGSSPVFVIGLVFLLVRLFESILNSSAFVAIAIAITPKRKYLEKWILFLIQI